MYKLLYILVLFITLFVLPCSISASTVNLLQNPSADGGMSHWEFTPDVVQSTDSFSSSTGIVLPYSDPYFFSMTKNAATEAYMIQLVNVSGLSGQPYYSGGWIQTEINPNPDGFSDLGRLLIQFRNRSDTIVGATASGLLEYSVNPSSYIQFQLSGLVPKDAEVAVFKLEGIGRTEPYVNVYYDDLYFSFNDEDDDTILDGMDNCPNIANSNQEDLDNDKKGDACDTSDDTDDDDDTVIDSVDMCSGTVNEEGTFTRMVTTHRWYWNGTILKQKFNYAGKTNPLIFTIKDTLGCSCHQILGILDDGKSDNYSAHYKFGCSTGILESFIKHST